MRRWSCLCQDANGDSGASWKRRYKLYHCSYTFYRSSLQCIEAINDKSQTMQTYKGEIAKLWMKWQGVQAKGYCEGSQAPKKSSYKAIGFC